MNKVNTEGKNTSKLKALAVISFIIITILIAWASVQLVNIVPGAFSSLASVAESIREDNSSEIQDEITPLVVTSNTTLISSGESVVISWNTSKRSGSYTFSHECAEGASLTIVDSDGEKVIDCGVNYNLGDIGSVTVLAESEKNRFQDIRYKIDFIPTQSDFPSASGSASITVVNSSIQDYVSNDDTEEENSAVTEEVQTPETESGTPTYEQEFVYEIPVSNPNGFTDLSTKYVATGNIVAGTFVPGYVERESDGAIQFEVKNFGSKTSGEWTFTVSLPNGGEYESKDQGPLKPNERAVITIGFVTPDVYSHEFEIKIDERTDNNTRNNKFTQLIYFR